MPYPSKYVLWLEAQVEKLQSDAEEIEAKANARALAGSISQGEYFERLGWVERLRARASDYRRKAMDRRAEDNRRRRNPAA